jgi:hypothetical protein
MFVVFDMTHGQRLSSFRTQAEAIVALEKLKAGNPTEASDFGVRELDEHGIPAGEFITEPGVAAQ